MTDWSEYELDLHQLCSDKAADFALLGYADVAPEAIWACVASKWKEKPPLHTAVADILGLQIGQFMNHLTMNAYKGKFEDDEEPFPSIRSGGVFDRPNRG